MPRSQARFITPNLQPLKDATAYWKQRCLVERSSIFWSEPLWTATNFATVMPIFDSPMVRNTGFYKELQKRIADYPEESIMLLAEVIWFMLLPQKKTVAQLKRDYVNMVIGWTGHTPERKSFLMTDDIMQGLIATPHTYKMYFWEEMHYLCEVCHGFLQLSKKVRKKYLDDSELFVRWLDENADGSRWYMRNMLLYFVFPGEFEPVFDRRNRLKIMRTYSLNTHPRSMSNSEIDRELVYIRKQLEEDHQQPIDFWRSRHIYEEWHNYTNQRARRTIGVPIEYPGLAQALRRSEEKAMKAKKAKETKEARKAKEAQEAEEAKTQ